MAIKFTAESFLEIVKRSRLVSQDQMQRALAEAKTAGVNIEDSREISNVLVEKTGLTRWQADKLLQGKHKGFFLGKYRLLSLLGKGGMGSVYLAEHTLMRRRCAIKVLPAKRVHDTSYLGRFHREAQAVAALDHLNIVRAYDVDKEQEGETEIHFLVMEFVDGRSLLEIVLQDGPLDYVKAADYIRQASDGLTHAHQANMVHRDIKPGNLLVDDNGVVKILDLGLARFFGGEDDEEQSLTVAHDEKVLGTADYLAPEQALDSHSVDARADIYSLGCTAYFLLTGHPPFTEGTLAQRLMAHQTKEPPPLEAECPGIPIDFLAIINRMMAKNVDERYQTAAAVNDALKAWLLKNAGDDWRLRNSAIIGSDSSTTHGKGSPSLKNLQEAPAGDSSTVAASSGVLSGIEQTQSATSPGDNGAGDDGNLAAFLSNLDSKLTPPAPEESAEDAPTIALETAAAESGKSGAESDTQKQPPAAIPVAAVAVPVKPSSTPIAAPAKPPTATPVAVAVAPSTSTGQAALPVAPAVPAAGQRSAESPLPAERSYARRTKRRRGGPGLAEKLKPLLNSKGARIGAMAAAGLVVLAAVIYGGVSFFGGGEEEGPGQADVAADTAADESSGDAAADSSPHTGQPPKTLGSGKLEVGPVAQFKTIGEALKHALDNYEPKRSKSELIIEVADGQPYAERIAVDGNYPAGIRIVAKEGARPVLAPTGKDPVIKLDGVERFSIEGFDMNAKGKPTAVELGGLLTACRIKDVKIDGFTQTGVLSNGAVGIGAYGQEVQLDRIEFRAGGDKAIGVKLRQGNYDSSQVKITDCRFHGPLAVGIQLQNGPAFISVRRCIFSGQETGIKFDGSNMQLFNISIGNCTFYKLDRGIVFTSIPSSVSHDLLIARNVFSGLKGLDIVVESEFDATAMYRMFSSSSGLATGWNWTTRARPAEAASGEFDLFSNEGKMGATIEFASEDARSERFLAPASGAPWAGRIPDDLKSDLKPYAGAVSP